MATTDRRHRMVRHLTMTTEGPTRTPTGWRLMAGIMLAGGLLLGFVAALGPLAPWLLSVTAIAVVVGVLPTVVAGRWPEPLTGDGRRLVDTVSVDPASLPIVSIVVAGRDEASVLPRLVADVAAQDHRAADGSPRFELIVVDDRSVDGTEDAVMGEAEAAGIDRITRVIRRAGEGLPDGKGAALTAAQPELCRGDVVLVLDADARIGPGFVRRVAANIALGRAAITARREIARPWSGLLSGVQADEQATDAALQNGRWRGGGASEFRGNGIAIRRDLLMSVGGWRDALTEDLDLTSRVAARMGVRVAWDPELVVAEQPVRSVRSLLRQRLRWAEGALRRVFEHLPAVLVSGRYPLRARIDFAIYAAQLAAPGLVLGALVGMVVGGRPVTALGLVATYLLAGAALTFEGLRFERRDPGHPLGLPERVLRSVRGGLFTAFWLVAVPGALWRLAVRTGPVRYDKMEHLGEDHEPVAAAVPPGRTS